MLRRDGSGPLDATLQGDLEQAVRLERVFSDRDLQLVFGSDALD